MPYPNWLQRFRTFAASPRFAESFAPLVGTFGAMAPNTPGGRAAAFAVPWAMEQAERQRAASQLLPALDTARQFEPAAVPNPWAARPFGGGSAPAPPIAGPSGGWPGPTGGWQSGSWLTPAGRAAIAGVLSAVPGLAHLGRAMLAGGLPAQPVAPQPVAPSAASTPGGAAAPAGPTIPPAAPAQASAVPTGWSWEPPGYPTPGSVTEAAGSGAYPFYVGPMRPAAAPFSAEAFSHLPVETQLQIADRYLRASGIPNEMVNDAVNRLYNAALTQNAVIQPLTAERENAAAIQAANIQAAARAEMERQAAQDRWAMFFASQEAAERARAAQAQAARELAEANAKKVAKYIQLPEGRWEARDAYGNVVATGTGSVVRPSAAGQGAGGPVRDAKRVKEALISVLRELRPRTVETVFRNYAVRNAQSPIEAAWNELVYGPRGEAGEGGEGAAYLPDNYRRWLLDRYMELEGLNETEYRKALEGIRAQARALMRQPAQAAQPVAWTPRTEEGRRALLQGKDPDIVRQAEDIWLRSRGG